MVGPSPPVRTVSSESAAVLALVDLSGQLQRRGEAIARLAGLSAQQWLLLLHVAGEPGLPRLAQGHDGEGILAREVALIRGVTQANISRLVSGLIGRGLVKQGGDKRDARRRRLFLTGRGRRTLDRVEPFRQRANQLLLSDLSGSERAQFVRCLHRCLDRLQIDREDAYLDEGRAPRARKSR
jgi:DNA-binding MarR family transcriptional regulator